MDDLLSDDYDDSFSDSGKQYVYKVIRELGKGSFGRVCLCERSDGKSTMQCAVKIYSKSFLKNEKRIEKVNGRIVFSDALQQVEREFAIMKKLHHPNLVKLIDVIDDPDEDRLYMVIEYVENGQIMYSNVKSHIYYSKETMGPLPESKARRYFRDIITALKYLHEHGVVHRDIKPENILLTKDDHSDFGVAHIFTNLYRSDSISNTNININNSQQSLQEEETREQKDSIEEEIQEYENDINQLSSYDDYNVQLYHRLSHPKGLNKSLENLKEDLNHDLFSNTKEIESNLSSNLYDNEASLPEISQSLSEITKTIDGDLQNTAGTMYYMPPEVCFGNKYNTFAADIWAAGVTLYVMIEGTLPIWIDNPIDFYEELEQCHFQIPTNISKDLLILNKIIDLLSKLLEKDPNQRITIPDIIDHPWFKGKDDYEIQTISPPINIRNSISLKEIKNAFTSSNSFILTQNDTQDLSPIPIMNPSISIAPNPSIQKIETITEESYPSEIDSEPNKKCLIL